MKTNPEQSKQEVQPQSPHEWIIRQLRRMSHKHKQNLPWTGYRLISEPINQPEAFGDQPSETPLSFLSNPTILMFASVKAAAGDAYELGLLSPQTGTCPATSGPQRASVTDKAARPEARVVGREIKKSELPQTTARTPFFYNNIYEMLDVTHYIQIHEIVQSLSECYKQITYR